MQELTSKQAQVLAYIQRRVQRTGQAPSYREIAAQLGVRVRTAYQHVQALERKGVLTRARRHRGLHLATDHLPPTGLPIVGRVAAGTPILATENIDGYLEIDRLLEDRSTLFALQVKGDSMIDRQIHEGDYVIVRTQPWVEHGDIGVIAIDEEITVKTVLHRRASFVAGVGRSGEHRAVTVTRTRRETEATHGAATHGPPLSAGGILHDDSEKTFLGGTGRWNGEDVVKIIVKQPATARFIARHLYN